MVLDVDGRSCVVIGCGVVGRRKASALASAGARVIVVDPLGCDLEGVEVVTRVWQTGDTDSAFIVVIATNDAAVNRAVAAETADALVLRADHADEGNLRMPAVEQTGTLRVAIDSGGASPALAAVARNEVATFLSTEVWTELGGWASEHRPVSVDAVRVRLNELRGAT